MTEPRRWQSCVFFYLQAYLRGYLSFNMTSEEKDLINQIRSKDTELKSREKALKRLGEILEESFILDLLPSKTIIQALDKIAASKVEPASLRRKAKALVQTYKI